MAPKKKVVKSRSKKAPVTFGQIQAAIIGDIGAEIMKAKNLIDLIEFELFASAKTAKLIFAFDKQEEGK